MWIIFNKIGGLGIEDLVLCFDIDYYVLELFDLGV